MNWRTYDWKNQKVGQRGEVLDRGDYRCGFCKGTGIVSTTKASGCHVCSGTGRALLPGWAVICAYCNGTGRAHLNKDIPCNICRGHGVVAIERNDVATCAACKGQGRAHSSGLPCLTCKGKGVMTKKEAYHG